MSQLKVIALLRKFGKKVKGKEHMQYFSGTYGAPVSQINAKVVDEELDEIEAEIHKLLARRKIGKVQNRAASARRA